MADKAFKIVLLLLLLVWSGYFVFRLAIGLIDAWRIGRLCLTERRKHTVRIVRSAAHPVAFWFTMAAWHVLLVAFAGLFLAGVYGIWRVAFAT